MKKLHPLFIFSILSVVNSNAFGLSEKGAIEIARDPRNPNFFLIGKLPVIPQSEDAADAINKKFEDTKITKTWCDLKYQPTAAGALVYRVSFCVNNPPEY